MIMRSIWFDPIIFMGAFCKSILYFVAIFHVYLIGTKCSVSMFCVEKLHMFANNIQILKVRHLNFYFNKLYLMKKNSGITKSDNH